MQTAESKWYIYTIIGVLSLFSICVCWQPLTLSIDSLYGFLTYKGTLLTGQFNSVADVSPANINQVDATFVTWWSPGQWLVPGLFTYTTGMRPGVATILITILFSISGLAGYYKVFMLYRFSAAISSLALLLICLSDTFYYSFIVYQGGEILSFGIFPWFLLYVSKTQKVTAGSLVLLSLFFIACFIAKTTLLVYCSVVLLYKVIEPTLQELIRAKRFVFRPAQLYYVLPILFCTILIYTCFFNRNTEQVPSLVTRLKISPDDFLVPLSSPLSSILSLQTLILNTGRWFKGAGANVETVRSIISVLYLLLTVAVGWIGYQILRNRSIAVDYKKLLLTVYGGVACFFIFAYSMNTNIDFSARHFKLLGYLFIPGLLMVLQQYLRPGYLTALTGIAGILLLAGFIFLKQKWSAGNYIGDNYFYRNHAILKERDRLDEASYHALMDIQHRVLNQPADRNAVFFIEANSDVALEIPASCIMKTPITRSVKTYHGKGPVVIACISKQTMVAEPGLLQQVFPDYTEFRLLEETATYRYYRADQ